ncbi:hypothetical protein Vretifemale_17806 [Volvox reticuliferus]|nr:hypothetical protein Vretifemale_17806 [Volvox reticuliferus]
MVRQEGILSPFKGLTYPLLFASVQSAILFQAYGWTLRQMASPSPPAPPSPPAQQQYNNHHHQHQEPVGLPPAPAHPYLDRRPSARAQIKAEAHPQHQACGAHPSPNTASSISSSCSSSSCSSSSPVLCSTALHQLHLHHHHHLQEQQMAEVHSPPSVSGRLLNWIEAQMSTGRGYADGGGAAAVGRHPQGHDDTASGSTYPVSSRNSSSAGAGNGGNCSSCRSNSSSNNGDGVYGGWSSQSDCSPDRSDHNHQQQQQQQSRLPTPWHGFVAGSVSGFAQVFLWSPVELLKLRAQLQTATPGSPGYRNPAALAAQVLRQDGVAGLYRGFTLTVIRDVPSYAMYFWLYHDIAGALSPGVHPEAAPPTTQVVAGGLAGVIAWLPIYPLDVLKTRVQAVTASASQGKTWMHFAREMYQEAGARAFFRGVAPTLVRAFLMDGASFLGYTSTLKLLGGAGGGSDGCDGDQRQAPSAVEVVATAAAGAAPVPSAVPTAHV